MINFSNFIYDAQSVMSFAVQQATNIESTVYEVKYPSFEYETFIPVVTEGNGWQKTTTFFSTDFAGKAEWISGAARDMPYADIDRAMFEHPFYMAGIGYEWNLEELQTAMYMQQPVKDDKAKAARKISQQFCWTLAMTGDGAKGWTGLINDASVSAGDVAADGTGSTTWWANKTQDQILRDVNAGLSGVFTGSGEVEMADTVLLPTSAFLDISSRARSSQSDTTILEYLLKNNVYTAQTGRPLMVRALRDLDTADPGGDGRMIVYRRDPEVLRFHLPMPHRFLEVWRNGPMNWMVPGILRTGGVEVRLPKAVRYLDGIIDS